MSLRLLRFLSAAHSSDERLTMKRQVLHRERAHLKVPGCSWVLSALLTKKLPTFLSRLNEISGGCEKILPVSGSFWSNLKLLRMMLERFSFN